MAQLIFPSIGFIIWSISIILIYYSKSYSGIDHIESTTNLWGYLMTILFFYAIYKGYTLFLSPRKKIKIWFFGILWGIFLHILILSWFYSSFPEVVQSPLMWWAIPSSVTLFIHILSLLIYPLILVLLTRSVGYTLLHFIFQDWRKEDMRIRVIIEISLGFLIFSSFLLIFWMFWLYNLNTLYIILGIMIAIGYLWHKETYQDIRTRYVEIENHNLDWSLIETMNLKLISIEFWFLFLTFILGVSLINIIRPMPIGWDDLGVYMNIPKMIATSWELLQWGGLYPWQLITGTGFFFSYTAAQAFFVNQLGWILAVIALICSLSYIFEEKNRKSLLSLPVLLAAVYYIMPMTVFQQAKDMKLDPALLFFSISAFIWIFSLWREEYTNKKIFTILFISGLLVGFAFWVKITTLMLILWGLGLIAYRYLSFLGYIWFFSFFIALFTYWNLWAKLNVILPNDSLFIRSSTLVFLFVGIVSFAGALYSQKWKQGQFYNWLIASIVFILGIVVSLSPWFIKNYQEAQILSIDSLIGWSWWTTMYDYKQFYTKEELAAIDKQSIEWITTSGQSQNEDMGRYFWYDSGINNYLKLPANLTFQKNQSGEFTDITYIFLALVPWLLLFVRSRKYIFLYTGVILLWSMLLYYFIPTTSASITAFLNKIGLGDWLGYAIILWLNIFYLTLAHYSLKESPQNKKLKDILMFMWVYGFIFMISAFGIVWYGIMIYFWFFLIIGLSATSFLEYDHEEEKNSDLIGIKLTLAAILFIFIAVYFFRSGLPHAWNNLKSAYYNEYKYNILSQEESIFAYRSDYLLPIATMNLKDIGKLFDWFEGKMVSKEMKSFVASPEFKNVDIEKLHSLIMQYRSSKDASMRKDMHTLGQYIYSYILYPPKGNQNTGWIYRIGTFMTYLINDNRKRYLEDSLISTFGDYFYNKSPEVTIDRMKKVGLKYLLMDLNAATIDRDPRRALTTRFEKLLLTTTAKNLRLVRTDNFCLELAINERAKWKLQTDQEFIDIAGTNYESYRDGKSINRGQKMAQCQAYIIKMMNDNTIADYPIIETIKKEIVAANANQDIKKIQEILTKYTGQSWFALFEIIDIPTSSSLSWSSATASWAISSSSGNTK